MNKLFQALDDLKGIEKSEYERVTDFGETLDFQTVYLLHLESNRFLVDVNKKNIHGRPKKI